MKKLNVEEAAHRIRQINRENIGWIPALRGGIRGHLLKKQVIRYHSSKRKEQFLGRSDGKKPWVHLSTIQEITEIIRNFERNFMLDYDFGTEIIIIYSVCSAYVSCGEIIKQEVLLKFSLRNHCSKILKKEILEMITPFLSKDKQDAISYFVLEKEFAV